MDRTPRGKQRKRFGTVLGAVGVTATLAIAGCSPADAGDSSASADVPFFFGAFATPLEEPWDGAVHDALQEVADEGLIRYEYVDQLATADEMERGLRDIIQNQQPDVIFGDSFAAEEAVRSVATDFPEIAFVFGSGGEEQEPNFSVFDNWLQDPGYLSGMLAGGLSESNRIGVVAAMPIPEVNRIVNAFIAGVNETNAEATVTVSFINSFFDPATAKQAAEAAIAGGADVLFAEREGVISAALEYQLPVIGMMTDQKSQAPEYVATSLVWHMRPTVDEVLRELERDTFRARNLGEYSFMIAGGSELAEINRETAYPIPEELIALVMEREAEIRSGAFVTPVNEDVPPGVTESGS